MDPNEESGFQFAITLLAAFATMIYASYTYFQNNSVDNYFYVVIVAVILSLLISSILLIGYIIASGYSMEKQGTAKTLWKKYASNLYSITFSVGLLLLLVIIGLFLIINFVGPLYAIPFMFVVIFSYLFLNELKSYSLKFLEGLKQLYLNVFKEINKISVVYKTILLTIITILIIFLMSFKYAIILWLFIICSYFFSRLKINPLEKKKETMVIFISLFLILVWGMLYTSTFSYIQGHVTIDMNSIYNKNDRQIPVYIEVTGRNDNASIELYQLNSMTPIETLELETEYNSSKNLNRENSTLKGNSFYSGKYYVFINTTKLSEGYYELVYTRRIDNYKYGKSFYLLNAN